MPSSVQSGPYFHWIDDTRVVPAHVRDKETAILIHGFTSHGSYLKGLAGMLDASQIQTLIFSYQSWRGIRDAALGLDSLLRGIDRLSNGLLCRRKVVLIGHSMGGLVARATFLYTETQQLVRGIATLGTPNNGAIGNPQIIDQFVALSEYISEVNPKLNRSCQTARELMKCDSTPTCIDQINRDWSVCRSRPPYLSISGGYAHAEFGTSLWVNVLKNMVIQYMMNGEPNDGLVTEASACAADPSLHWNQYASYGQVNHTFLKDNMEVHLKLLEWIRSLSTT